MRIACLSTISDPLLGYWLRVVQIPSVEVHVVLDEKSLSEKDLAIWGDRTDGRLPPIDLYSHVGVPFYFTRDHNGAETVELLQRLDIDLALNCGTPRILKRPIIDAPRIGVLNCHPGRLPDYRGCSAVEWALYNGDPVCNTAHLMTERIDDGPIIAIEEVNVESGDSYTDIRVKTYKAGVALMGKAVGMLVKDENAVVLPSGRGRYWKPIDDEKFALVKSRLQPA